MVKFERVFPLRSFDLDPSNNTFIEIKGQISAARVQDQSAVE